MEEKDLKNLVSRYGIYLPENHPGCFGVRHRPKAQEQVDFLKAHKPEIMEYLTKQRREKEERKAKIAAIPGLAEMQKKYDEFSRQMAKYSKDKEAYFEERGSYPVFPKRPDASEYNFDELKEKYPQADAYLKAEFLSFSDSYELASVGRKLLQEVIDGNWKDIDEKIETAKHKFAIAHMWD